MKSSERLIVWGDSLCKGVVFDENRGRYAVLERSAVNIISQFFRYQTLNRAKMGLTVTKGRRILQEDLKNGVEADVAFIEFGGNDSDFDWQAISREPDGEHIPRTSLPEFEKNLASMVQEVKQAGLEPILSTLPPVDSEHYFDFISRGGLNQQNILKWLGDKNHIYRFHEQYSLVISKVARECRCRLIDLRAVFLAQKNPYAYYCTDGIHPNSAGHQLMADAVIEALKNGSIV